MKILITEPELYSEQAIDIYSQLGEVILANSYECIKENWSVVDVLVVKLKYTWTEEHLLKADSLKIIVTSTTGLDHIHLPSGSAIQIVSLKGETDFLNTVTPTAELTWALILNLARKIPQAIKSVKLKQWERNSFIGQELNGMTMGIIGYGRLGRMVANYSIAFGMDVQIYDVDKNLNESLQNGVKSVSLHNLLKTSDVVSVHIPLEDKNVDFLNKTRLSSLKPGCLFINTSRGEVLDEAFLLRLLQENHIAGVALDVLSDESAGYTDWIEKNKLINSHLLGSRLLVTPHIGGACSNSMARTEEFVARKVEAKIRSEKAC